MFYGAGAGGVQTASAVLGDVVSAARRHIAGGVGVGESTLANLPIVPIGRVTTRYQITLEVDASATRCPARRACSTPACR
jgi:homoserine dehydrogenase